MVMSWIWCGIVFVCIASSVILGKGGALAGAVVQGAQSGITLSVSIAGSLCLWSGVGKLMEVSGLTRGLSRLLKPVLFRLFPGSRKDPVLAGSLSANICANFLGLGNAATPMGIAAVKRMKQAGNPGLATDEMCRLIVLNTASIQLIPATVAAVRASLGCAAPFDILPAVWITSVCSAGMGVTLAFFLGKVWRND